MSTAYNHMVRSHRSQHKSVCYTGSRRSVIKPTIRKSGLMYRMAQIRKLLQKKNRKEDEE